MSKFCQDCRYWSELMARAEGGYITAMCLVDAGPRRQQYTRALDTCQKWEAGDPVDMPTPDTEPAE